ncbi:MAG: hypothetical protein ABI779_14165 [Acidobacteriota bacterium]
MQRARVLSVVLLTLACSSAGSSRPADVKSPTIVVQQAGPIFFGSGTSAPVSLDVYVKNNADVPIRLREVEIRSPGMTQYTLLRVAKLFGETIPPGETRTVSLVATAVRSSTRFQMAEPLSIVATVRLEAKGKAFREFIMQRVAGEGPN